MEDGGVKRSDREIESLRRQYRDHRDTVARLIDRAPSEQLADEYRRVLREIDAAVAKLDELDFVRPAAAAAAPRTMAPSKQHGDPLRWEDPPAERPLAHTPEADEEPVLLDDDTGARRRGGGGLLLVMTGALIAILLIGYLVWRASRGDDATEVVGGETATVATEPAENPPADTGTIVETDTTPTAAPAPPGTPRTAMTVEPASHDYGVVRKGTRAVRQYEIVNRVGEPIDYTVARSQCRCLYYEYRGKLAPNERDTLTVTIDGAKAPAGPLNETVAITSKTNPAISTRFVVAATIE